jgi:transposase, IS5 family
VELVMQLNEFIGEQGVKELRGEQTTEAGSDASETATAAPAAENQGQLIIDATCAPADIQYPTDLNLLNEAREQTERVIDELYKQQQGKLKHKPRTYRRVARKEYFSVVKKRKPSRQEIRKGIGKQLSYVRRNLRYIDEMIAEGASLSLLDKRLYRLLLVVSEVYRQQQQMYDKETNRIDDRIVSLTQPHVRPIVRGKAGTPVEFGAKVSASCVDGYVFLDHLSWDNFNESVDLKTQVERYRERFGYYPESVHADQIYRTKANIKWCQERGIRLSGLPLSKATPAAQMDAQAKQQQRADEAVRVEIEGKFGQGKRRFGLARVMAKLTETAETAIAITFLVMNLEQRLRRLMLFWLNGLFDDDQGVLSFSYCFTRRGCWA